MNRKFGVEEVYRYIIVISRRSDGERETITLGPFLSKIHTESQLKRDTEWLTSNGYDIVESRIEVANSWTRL